MTISGRGFARRAISFLARGYRTGASGISTPVCDFLQGKDVLDLRCGHTLYGISFLVYGSRNYPGIDPKLELDALKGETDDEKVFMGV